MESVRNAFVPSQTYPYSSGGDSIAASGMASNHELEQAWHQRMSHSPLTVEKLATLECLVKGGKSVNDALSMAACFEARGIPFNHATAITYFQEIDPSSLRPIDKEWVGQSTAWLCEYEENGVRRQAVFKPERKLNPLARNMLQVSLNAGVVDIRKGKITRPPRFALRSVAASRVAERMGLDLLPKTRLSIGICNGTAVVGSVSDYCEGHAAFSRHSDDDVVSSTDAPPDRKHLLATPAFFENMLMLQIVDLLIAEPDRTWDNYRVQWDGTVKALDTEQCFGSKLGSLADMVQHDKSEAHLQEERELGASLPLESCWFYFRDVPKVITESIAARVGKLKAEDIAAILDELMLPDGVAASRTRVAEVKHRLVQSTIVPDGCLRLEDCVDTYLERDWIARDGTGKKISPGAAP